MKIPFEIYPPLKVTVTMRKEKRETKGYRNRYDIIDHGHKKNTFMYFFHRSVFAEIRKFATIVFKCRAVARSENPGGHIVLGGD